MKECDKPNSHISTKLHMICISSDNDRHLVIQTFTPLTTLYCTSLHFTTFHYTSLHFTPLHCIYSTSLHFTTFHYNLLHFTPLHCTSLHFTTFHYTLLHFTALHYISLHFTALHSTSLHCTSLHFTELQCASLHFTKLYCTSLHFTTLHCTSLHYNCRTGKPTLIFITSREFKAKRLSSSVLKGTFWCPKQRDANSCDIRMVGNTGQGLMSTENRIDRHTIWQMPQLWRGLRGNAAWEQKR